MYDNIVNKMDRLKDGTPFTGILKDVYDIGVEDSVFIARQNIDKMDEAFKKAQQGITGEDDAAEKNDSNEVVKEPEQQEQSNAKAEEESS